MSEEFVMVPRKMLQAAYDETEDTRYHQEWMREVLSDQHQGEPVAFCWSYKMGGEQRFFPRDPRKENWGVDMSEYITDVEPLYTHADPGEVERLREENDAIRLQAGGMQMELDELRAQLAERDALLERALRLLTPNIGRFRGSFAWAVEVDRFLAALSASAPVGDGVHDDTEAVRARLAANYFESKP